MLEKNNLPQWLLITGFVLALIGFADAGYLSMKYLSGEKPKCFITTGCDAVTSSIYSKIGPFPVASLGFIFYTTLLVLFFLSLESKETKWAKYALIITPLGFLFTVYFLYIQAFVLNAFCIYCLFSAGSSTALFGLAMFHWIKNKFWLNLT
ncbi:MAG: hypothetical protein A2821_01855 [Candidatus Magasanikbacteria bacterium RIFCSPHIGHO2_01_FULL_41_23]|uniref:Vitamin K epoxide reductase domain-containing protein n=1 Tax=Candidatus Magasanikbacteria bacterium RIFCSPLOWO2_01_FULL_40_15 TaxID=1798686 RepID=A0A1F6N3M9_9BACT|nr:MAG: hypothetical protein A2821_01855 [Candidatus Magasanikbacteria bacterium RIFCSPHIGHO2_01_FULL_41_23]OGH67091.1 MAG: hypothetical protein A3C66_00160 [Candidatus Magasanikbacteria bacterium RIFCSPHIGHO2_02_FULL_41_35]OGH76411.1 MAG: hypothetical protein A3F22_02330 [Candidatus Magasanikbacteria bacterium RIFCSPHIGHO2_12_FULL_41_16]OGH78358.1 MAG: hypothetical protein A2983_00105 [Candidatus Magasanikbacteria bacterium RIFCSPLOWO2_01_FULL_40_15]